jgi:hypothetical protein
MEHKAYTKQPQEKIMQLLPPQSDSETERHKFYAALTAALNNISSSQERTFKVLSEVENSISDQHKFQTRIYAMGSAFSILWFIFSGAIGWYANRVVNNYDLMVAKVEKMERSLEIAELKGKPLEAIPDKVDALKSRVTRLEDMIERSKGEK